MIKAAMIAASLISTSVYAEAPATMKNYMNKAEIPNASASVWNVNELQAQKREQELFKAIEANPNKKENYANLGHLYLLNNKSVQAIGAYQDAINYDSDNPKLFAALSIAYLHQSKFSMAKAMADQAVTLDPSMKHAMKIKEYIQAKEDVIAQTSRSSYVPPMDDSLHGNIKASGEKPADKIHGATAN